VSFHTIPPLWRAELDFMADFVFMQLASGSRPARVKVLRARLGANEIALRVAKTTVFPLSTFVRFREIVAKRVSFLLANENPTFYE
jgi:hypothetical protein